MNYAKRLIYIVLITASYYHVTYENTSDHNRILSFDDLKHYISFYESSNGKFKFNRNTNGTVDCGLYQVNSSHFGQSANRVIKHRVGVDSIFALFGIGSKVSVRITETIRNDSLCYCLAEYIYNTQGIDKWSCYKKFKPYLEGYIYHHATDSPKRNKQRK
jgi:hypothetical protein